MRDFISVAFLTRIHTLIPTRTHTTQSPRPAKIFPTHLRISSSRWTLCANENAISSSLMARTILGKRMPLVENEVEETITSLGGKRFWVEDQAPLVGKNKTKTSPSGVDDSGSRRLRLESNCTIKKRRGGRVSIWGVSKQTSK